jgi:hypothetical protein
MPFPYQDSVRFHGTQKANEERKSLRDVVV